MGRLPVIQRPNADQVSQGDQGDQGRQGDEGRLNPYDS